MSTEKKVKINSKFIQQQLEGNELDLSMNGLDVVPVRELVSSFVFVFDSAHRSYFPFITDPM